MEKLANVEDAHDEPLRRPLHLQDKLATVEGPFDVAMGWYKAALLERDEAFRKMEELKSEHAQKLVDSNLDLMKKLANVENVHDEAMRRLQHLQGKLAAAEGTPAIPFQGYFESRPAAQRHLQVHPAPHSQHWQYRLP